MTKRYYHITSFEGFLKISKEGIKASADGYIYLLDTKDYNAYVASNQLGYNDYGVFEINPDGITVEIKPDKVGEITAKHQFRIKQSLIEKQYLKFKGMYKLSLPY
jgi:hypothetical protein